MGLVEFLIFAVIVVVVGWAAIYVMGRLAPGHPAIIDNIIWVAVFLIVLLKLVTAAGLVGHDIQIPRIR